MPLSCMKKPFLRFIKLLYVILNWWMTIFLHCVNLPNQSRHQGIPYQLSESPSYLQAFSSFVSQNKTSASTWEASFIPLGLFFFFFEIDSTCNTILVQVYNIMILYLYILWNDRQITFLWPKYAAWEKSYSSITGTNIHRVARLKNKGYSIKFKFHIMTNF